MNNYLQGSMLAAVCIALVSCTSPKSHLAAGTAVGAASGALVGQALGGNGVLGAVVGGGIGYYVSSEQVRAINNIEKFHGHVLQYGDRVEIVIPTKDLYERDSTYLTNRASEVMDDIVTLLKPYSQKPITIRAYTDNLRTQKNSLSLTRGQAQGIANVLWHKGFIAENLSIMGMGKASSVSNNYTEKGRDLNRRIEITIKMN